MASSLNPEKSGSKKNQHMDPEKISEMILHMDPQKISEMIPQMDPAA